MIERLKQVLEYYQLSASNFADKIDVPRSSISHLLSGRNKPSLDFIIKVDKAFVEVELDWLVYGKGNFPKLKKAVATKIDVETTTSAPSLFSESEELNISKKNELISKYKQENVQDKEIKKIVILYTDGTFEDYKK